MTAGARRVRGKRGRGAGSKTIVFGIYKRNGKVHAEIVPNAQKKTLQNIIRSKRFARLGDSFGRLAQA